MRSSVQAPRHCVAEFNTRRLAFSVTAADTAFRRQPPIETALRIPCHREGGFGGTECDIFFDSHLKEVWTGFAPAWWLSDDRLDRFRCDSIGGRFP
jgi:hypothetical protein